MWWNSCRNTCLNGNIMKPQILTEVEREVEEHEVFLSFNSDDEAVQFEYWLHDAGFKAFQVWNKEQQE